MMKNSKRLYGIDLLRILAMFMVVIVHTVGWYTLKGHEEGATPITKLLQSLVISAVDVFALMTGFLQGCRLTVGGG